MSGGNDVELYAVRWYTELRFSLGGSCRTTEVESLSSYVESFRLSVLILDRGPGGDGW